MDSRREALPSLFILVGAMTALAGMVPLLAALDVIPADRAEFGAPRWIVALFGLAFVATGLLLALRALPSWRSGLDLNTPWIHRSSQVCGVIVLVAFFGGVLAFLNWKAFIDGGGGGDVTVTVLGFPVELPPALARVTERGLVTLFALGFDLLAAVSLWTAFDRRRPRE